MANHAGRDLDIIRRFLCFPRGNSWLPPAQRVPAKIPQPVSERDDDVVLPHFHDVGPVVSNGGAPPSHPANCRSRGNRTADTRLVIQFKCKRSGPNTWTFAPAPTGDCFSSTHFKALLPVGLTILIAGLVIPYTILKALRKQHKKNMLGTLESKTRFGCKFLGQCVCLGCAVV